MPCLTAQVRARARCRVRGRAWLCTCVHAHVMVCLEPACAWHAVGACACCTFTTTAAAHTHTHTLTHTHTHVRAHTRSRTHTHTGAVMLSGETANGKHPALVLSTMAAIVANTELAVDYREQYHAIRCVHCVTCARRSRACVRACVRADQQTSAGARAPADTRVARRARAASAVRARNTRVRVRGRRATAPLQGQQRWAGPREPRGVAVCGRVPAGAGLLRRQGRRRHHRARGGLPRGAWRRRARVCSRARACLCVCLCVCLVGVWWVCRGRLVVGAWWWAPGGGRLRVGRCPCCHGCPRARALAASAATHPAALRVRAPARAPHPQRHHCTPPPPPPPPRRSCSRRTAARRGSSQSTARPAPWSPSATATPCCARWAATTRSTPARCARARVCVRACVRTRALCVAWRGWRCGCGARAPCCCWLAAGPCLTLRPTSRASGGLPEREPLSCCGCRHQNGAGAGAGAEAALHAALDRANSTNSTTLAHSYGAVHPVAEHTRRRDARVPRPPPPSCACITPLSVARSCDTGPAA
jgi:hypothetical protein